MVIADLAARTIKTRFNNVRSVLRASVRDPLIAHDPADGVTIPRQRRREAAMELPTHEQVGALMAAADPSFKTFIALAAFAGLRLAEAAALQGRGRRLPPQEAGRSATGPARQPGQCRTEAS